MDGFQFLEEDVPDPTDFPESTPGLRLLDDAMRCKVCRELYHAPVIVNCPSGHCFCSSCIRSHIAHMSDPTCPLCLKEISESQIRKNPSMEDAVNAWNEARSLVLNLVKQGTPRVQSSDSSASSASGTVPNTPRKRRKITPVLESVNEEILEDSGPKKTEHGSSQGMYSPPSDSQLSKTELPNLVSCPVCNRMVPSADINAHLDRGCPSPTPSELERASNNHASSSKIKQKQEWSKLLGPGTMESTGAGLSSKGKGKAKATTPVVDDFEEALPKVSYNTISPRLLKEKLREFELPTIGEKATLIARHERWVILYNANRDASIAHRKTMKQLRDELRRWEDANAEDKRKKTKQGEVDALEHQETYRGIFMQLSESAKQSGRRTGNNGVPPTIASGSGADNQRTRQAGPSQPSGASNEDAIMVVE